MQHGFGRWVMVFNKKAILLEKRVMPAFFKLGNFKALPGEFWQLKTTHPKIARCETDLHNFVYHKISIPN